MKKIFFAFLFFGIGIVAKAGYNVTATPSSSNSNRSGTQQTVITLLKTQYPYAAYVKNSKGDYVVTIPNAPSPSPTPSPSPSPSPSPVGPLFLDPMTYTDGLLTNEYAFYNPSDPSAVKNTNWDMSSGSVFAHSNMGWTGIPDSVGSPNATSSNGNDSAIFRMTSKVATFKDVAVSFKLQNNGFVSTTLTPAVAWDGVHIFLRYQSEFSLYYASVLRRDGNCVIKKKVPGGNSNGGTYYDLSNYVAHAFPSGTFQTVKATIKTNVDNSVTIAIYVNNVLVLQATDSGTGGAPITAAGKTGIRGDNCNFYFDDFTVEAL